MELYDDAWDDDEAYSFGIVSRELRRYFWSESAWGASGSPSSTDADADGEADGQSVPVLFSDGGAEHELRAEIRLSQLWNRCRAGIVSSAEFSELSHLITAVDGIRGLLCMDCTTLDRPNVSANWALGDTMLCRGHLRFRLGHAHVEGDGVA
jgi:hypothetical protein